MNAQVLILIWEGEIFSGGSSILQPIILPIVSRKLHENERIWTPKRGSVPGAPPLGSANDILSSNKEKSGRNFDKFK